MIELFRSDNLLVRSLPAEDQSRWVVTFDNYGIGHGFDRPGFGEDFLKSQGISAIHVMGVREDWYQYPEIFEAMAAVKAAVAGAERVMTYGSSMGAYAALRFADAIDADAVLALSPQYTINPERVPFELRWTQDAGRIQWLPQIDKPLSMRAVPVIVYDPKIDDRKHFDLIRREIPVQGIRLPFTGHPTTTALSEVGLLKRLVLETLSGQLDVRAFHEEALKARRRSPSHLAALTRSQPPHRSRMALGVASRAIQIAPQHGEARLAAARALVRLGHGDAAVNILADLAKAHPDNLLYRVQYAEILSEVGRHAEAIEVAAAVVAETPGVAHLMAWKSHFHWMNEEHQEAINLIRQAMALDRLNPHFITMAKAYDDNLNLGRPVQIRRRKRPLQRLLIGLGLGRESDSPDAA